MELIHIVRTRHVQSINNVHRLNMGVKTKNFRIVKEHARRKDCVKTLMQVVRSSKNGGANRDRTDDLLLAKQALSQLSYGPAPRHSDIGGSGRSCTCDLTLIRGAL
jgi:hypothetical protein